MSADRWFVRLLLGGTGHPTRGQAGERASTTIGDRSPSFGEPWAPDVAWLGVGLLTGLAVYGAYLLTHPYPAYAGGLFLVMADRIAENGYLLPETIPRYTDDGIPFAYPPLLFYVTAVGHDLTGLPLLWFSRYLPGLFVVAYLVPYYGVARELLGSPRHAGLATVLFATTPTVLRWHVSAGGLVRAPAMFIVLAGVYVGIRLFRDRERAWLVPGAVLFGLAVLAHPTYAVFFALSYLVLFAFLDRSRGGLLAGATVALGGLVVAAPWLLQVVGRHGVDVFFTASGTHSGLGGGLERLVKLTYALNDSDVESLFYFGAYAGGAYALLDRRYLLPTWMAGSSYVIGKNRFLFVAGSMLTALVVLDVIAPRLRAARWLPDRREALAAGTVVVILLGAASVGVLYSASALPLAHEASPSQPAYLDDDDRRAMQWVSANTRPGDELVVLGDQAEWLPLFADRTILLGPWGWEWKEASGYYRELDRYDAVATCPEAACVTWSLASAGRDPEYVYVPKGRYTVRGKQYERGHRLLHTMGRADRYELAYENAGVAIFRVDWGPPETTGYPSVSDRSWVCSPSDEGLCAVSASDPPSGRWTRRTT